MNCMAKLELNLTGSFDEILSDIEVEIVSGSLSAKLEDGTDWQLGNVRCAVRVFERYSMMGGNRVSLSITLLGQGNTIYLSAITAGGSQAVLFKINTLGEEAFLDCLRKIVTKYSR